MRQVLSSMKAFNELMVAAGLLVAATQVCATIITFEDLAEGATLSGQYAGLGVLFSPNAFSGANGNSTPQDWATNTGMTITATDIGAVGTPSLVSGKLLHSFNDWLSEDGDPSMVATFGPPVTSFSADFAGIFTGSDVTLTIYDGASIIGTVTGAACATTCQQTLSFAAPSITKVAFTPGSFSDWVGVDNITFSAAAAVPEPATLALLGLGLAGLGFSRRKQVAH
jgi:hypothetical protein